MAETKPGGTPGLSRELGVTVTTLVLLPALVTPVLTLGLAVTNLPAGDTPPVITPPALAALQPAAPGGRGGRVSPVTLGGLLAGLETFSRPLTLEVFSPELTETPGLWVEVTALPGLLPLVPVVPTLGEIVTNPNTVQTIFLVAFTWPLTASDWRDGEGEGVQEQKYQDHLGVLDFTVMD